METCTANLTRSTQKPLLSLSETSSTDAEKQDSLRPNVRNSKTTTALHASTFVLAVFAIGLSVFNYLYVNHYVEQRVCFPCNELYRAPPGFQGGDSGVTSRPADEDQLCCAENLKQLAKLIEQKTEKTARALSQSRTRDCANKTSAGCRPNPFHSNRTVAAHVVLPKNQDPRRQDGNRSPPLRGWNSRLNPSFLEKVGLQDDRLVIPETALYYVYSQLTMIDYHDDPTEVASSGGHQVDSIAHHIRRWNILYPEEEVLLRHSQSKTRDRSKPFTEYVSYLGGVMPLREGDELFVTVSDVLLVQPDTKSTYFGLYKI